MSAAAGFGALQRVIHLMFGSKEAPSMRQSKACATWILCFTAATLAATRADAGPTFVIDFKTADAGVTTALTDDKVGAFEAAAFGFATSDARDLLIQSVMTQLRRDFHNIPTMGVDGQSPIPDGKMLDVDFITGAIGEAPSNGASEYYYVQVGTGVGGPNVGGTTLGVAYLNAVRYASGSVGFAAVGSVVASIFTDAIVKLGGLTPSDILKSGDLAASTQALEGTLAHEIGHTLSLAHEKAVGAITPNDLPPLMGTGAIDLPNRARLGDRAFAYSSLDKDGRPLRPVAQLVGALGLRDQPLVPAVPEPASLAQAGIAMALAAGALLWRRRPAA